MKKKIVLSCLMVMLILSMSGCKNNRVDIVTGVTVFDTTEVRVDGDYTFIDFDKEYTDDGKCVITVTFDKNE